MQEIRKYDQQLCLLNFYLFEVDDLEVEDIDAEDDDEVGQEE